MKESHFTIGLDVRNTAMLLYPYHRLRLILPAFSGDAFHASIAILATSRESDVAGTEEMSGVFIYDDDARYLPEG